MRGQVSPRLIPPMPLTYLVSSPHTTPAVMKIFLLASVSHPATRLWSIASVMAFQLETFNLFLTHTSTPIMALTTNMNPTSWHISWKKLTLDACQVPSQQTNYSANSADITMSRHHLAQ